MIVGCCAAVYFQGTLQTFLSVIGYWTVIHITVVAIEHVFFRRGWAGYNLDAWDDPKELPLGWAAIGSFVGGFVGAALGMSVAWYVGPVAGLVGSGANLGHELTFGFSAVGFGGLRWLEKRWGGR